MPHVPASFRDDRELLLTLHFASVQVFYPNHERRRKPSTHSFTIENFTRKIFQNRLKITAISNSVLIPAQNDFYHGHFLKLLSKLQPMRAFHFANSIEWRFSSREIICDARSVSTYLFLFSCTMAIPGYHNHLWRVGSLFGTCLNNR